jgi:hypothetical protein
MLKKKAWIYMDISFHKWIQVTFFLSSDLFLYFFLPKKGQASPKYIKDEKIDTQGEDKNQSSLKKYKI